MIHDCDNCKYELYDSADYPCDDCRCDDYATGTVILRNWESDGSENVGHEIINFNPDWANATRDLIDECYSINEVIKALKILYKERRIND